MRALFDSMYKGFPVGYLLFWETGADAGARQIGVDTAAAVPNHLIVDGQQRLTSLFAVMTGATVLRDDYSQTRIRIAFRPSDATFAVTDAAIEKDPEFIADISALWHPGGKRATTKAYLKAVSAPTVGAETESGRPVVASFTARQTDSDLLGALQGILINGIGAAADSLHDTGGRLRTAAQAYATTDRRRAQLNETPRGGS